ncbi:MAG TPA: SRPBCC family protein [Stellaceae bacterium]|nr:SRPBCC family protein [Stellaceae bacterium]
MAALILLSAAAGPASAEIKSVTPTGFEVASAATIGAPPDRVYAALGDVGRWWSPSHTFSRDAANLSLELRADGCFCERLMNGGSVEHMVVVYAAPGEGLRLRGALGPLQSEGVDGTLGWTLKPAEGGTSVMLSYVVGGYIRGGMEQWAPRVDRVLDEQLQRLKNFVEGTSPRQ